VAHGQRLGPVEPKPDQFQKGSLITRRKTLSVKDFRSDLISFPKQ